MANMELEHIYGSKGEHWCENVVCLREQVGIILEIIDFNNMFRYLAATLASYNTTLA
jgi:hypothetical protein